MDRHRPDGLDHPLLQVNNEFRLSIGNARWTSAFTVPPGEYAALPASGQLPADYLAYRRVTWMELFFDLIFVAANQPNSADHVIGMQSPGIPANIANDELLRLPDR